MNKKNIIRGFSWLAFGVLLVEYVNLVKDFRLVEQTLRDNEEKFEQAKKIVTNGLFQDIVERFND